MVERIQRKRTKGWRKPPGAVYVGRGSEWGNPFPTHEPARDAHGDVIPGRKVEVRSAREAVNLYANMISPYRHHGKTSGLDNLLISLAHMGEIQKQLRGKDLMCWCPLDQPCHADFLLQVANEDPDYE